MSFCQLNLKLWDYVMLLINYTFVHPGSLQEHIPQLQKYALLCGGCPASVAAALPCSARCWFVPSFPALTMHQLLHSCELIRSRSPLTSYRLSFLYWELSEFPPVLGLFEVPIGHQECWAFQVRDAWIKSMQYPPQIHKALRSVNSVTLNMLKGLFTPQWCSHKPHPDNCHSQSTAKSVRCTRDILVSSRVRQGDDLSEIISKAVGFWPFIFMYWLCVLSRPFSSAGGFILVLFIRMPVIHSFLPECIAHLLGGRLYRTAVSWHRYAYLLVGGGLANCFCDQRWSAESGGWRATERGWKETLLPSP